MKKREDFDISSLSVLKGKFALLSFMKLTIKGDMSSNIFKKIKCLFKSIKLVAYVNQVLNFL
jgi:hypothetical protein